MSGKQVGVDHALRQVAWPVLFQMIELVLDDLADARLHAVGARGGLLIERAPAFDRQAVSPLLRKIGAGEMQSRQRRAERVAMPWIRPPDPHAVEEGDDRGGTPA